MRGSKWVRALRETKPAELQFMVRRACYMLALSLSEAATPNSYKDSPANSNLWLAGRVA